MMMMLAAPGMPCWHCAVVAWLAAGGRKRMKIEEAAWSKHADVAAGTVSIPDIQICSMQGRQAGQYYK
jgi:hypothetical protein